MMEPTKKTARAAGMFYLAIVFGGIFYMRYIPVTLIDRNDMAATVRNLGAHLTLFRVGIVIEIATNFFYLLLALTLYKLFNHVNKTYALLLVLLVGTSTIIDFVNLQNRLSILTLVDTAGHLSTFGATALQDQVLVYLNIYRDGIRVNEIFWGLWLFPLGYLIFRSGAMPKIIGILLMIGCFGYLADFTGSFFFANYSNLNITNYVIMPASIGELVTCLWLLVAGVKTNNT